MRSLKYFRALVLLSLVAVCLALSLWLVETGHRRLPLLVIAGYFVVTPLVMRKLPRSITGPIESRGILVMLASSLRFIGFVFALVCAIALFSYPFLNNPLPLWVAIPMLLWWGLWVWGAFWGSKWIRSKAIEMKSSELLGPTAALPGHDKTR